MDEGQETVISIEKGRVEVGDLALGDGDQATVADEATKFHLRPERRVPLAEGEVEDESRRSGIGGGRLGREVVSDGIRGVEEQDNVGERGAAEGSVGGDPGGVLGCAPVKLRESGAAKGSDGKFDRRFQFGKRGSGVGLLVFIVVVGELGAIEEARLGISVDS